MKVDKDGTKTYDYEVIQKQAINHEYDGIVYKFIPDNEFVEPFDDIEPGKTYYGWLIQTKGDTHTPEAVDGRGYIDTKEEAQAQLTDISPYYYL